MGKALLSGIGQGAIGMAQMPAQIGNWLGSKVTGGIGRMMGVDPAVTAQRQAQAQNILNSMPTNPANLQQNIESVTGQFHQPQNTPERYIDTAGQFLASLPVGGGKAADAARRVLPILTSAVGSEGAGQWAHEHAPYLEPAARFVGSILGGSALSGVERATTKNPMKEMRANAPTKQQVFNEMDHGYKVLENAGIKYDANAFTNFADKLARNFETKGRDPGLEPYSHVVLKKILEKRGKAISFQEFDTLRKIASRAARTAALGKNESDSGLATSIIAKLDEFSNSSPVTTNGSLAPSVVHGWAKNTRELARRNILANEVGKMDSKKVWYLSGDESAQRNQFSTFGKRNDAYLKDAERAAAMRVVRREGAHGLLNTAGSKLVQAGGLATTSALALSNPALWATAAILPMGLAARAISAAKTNKAVGNFTKTVLAGKTASSQAYKEQLARTARLKRNAIRGGLLGANAAIRLPNGSLLWNPTPEDRKQYPQQ
jgi:hypothetical protein